MVAVDDRRLGRQVFTSARAPLGSEPIGLFGRPGIWTEPAQLVERLGRDEAELVRASVGAAVHALPHDASVTDAARGSRAVSPSRPRSPAAVARARTHGWAFTLTLVRFDDGDHSPARIAGVWSGLRPGDVVDAAPAGVDAITLLLPATRDDEAATILAAAVRRGRLPRCAFGLVRCPADADSVARCSNSRVNASRKRSRRGIPAHAPSERYPPRRWSLGISSRCEDDGCFGVHAPGRPQRSPDF